MNGDELSKDWYFLPQCWIFFWLTFLLLIVVFPFNVVFPSIVAFPLRVRFPLVVVVSTVVAVFVSISAVSKIICIFKSKQSKLLFENFNLSFSLNSLYVIIKTNPWGLGQGGHSSGPVPVIIGQEKDLWILCPLLSSHKVLDPPLSPESTLSLWQLNLSCSCVEVLLLANSSRIFLLTCRRDSWCRGWCCRCPRWWWQSGHIVPILISALWCHCVTFYSKLLQVSGRHGSFYGIHVANCNHREVRILFNSINLKPSVIQLVWVISAVTEPILLASSLVKKRISRSNRMLYLTFPHSQLSVICTSSFGWWPDEKYPKEGT